MPAMVNTISAAVRSSRESSGMAVFRFVVLFCVAFYARAVGRQDGAAQRIRKMIG
jgi:hypothetical protein